MKRRIKCTAVMFMPSSPRAASKKNIKIKLLFKIGTVDTGRTGTYRTLSRHLLAFFIPRPIIISAGNVHGQWARRSRDDT